MTRKFLPLTALLLIVGVVSQTLRRAAGHHKGSQGALRHGRRKQLIWLRLKKPSQRPKQKQFR